MEKIQLLYLWQRHILNLLMYMILNMNIKFYGILKILNYVKIFIFKKINKN